MNMGKCVGCVLLAMVSLSLTGCGTGTRSAAGVFGSYLDSDDLGDGYGIGGKVEVKPADALSVEGRVSWMYFSDVEVHMIPLELVGRVNWPLLDERVIPYIGVGGGYYFFEGDDVDLDNSGGFFPLAGLEVGRRRASLFAEVRWLFLNADIEDGGNELGNRREADVDGFGFNAGVLFRF